MNNIFKNIIIGSSIFSSLSTPLLTPAQTLECNPEISVIASVIEIPKEERRNHEEYVQILKEYQERRKEQEKKRIEEKIKEQERIEEQKRLEEQKKIEEQERLEEQKRIEEEKRLEEQRKLEEEKKAEEIKRQQENSGKIVSGTPINNTQIHVDELSPADKKIAEKIVNAIQNNKNNISFENENFDHMLNVVQAVQDTYFYAYLDSEFTVNEYADGSVEVVMSGKTKSNYDKSKIVSNEIKRVGNSLKGLTEKNAVSKLNNYIKQNFTYKTDIRDLYSLVANRIGNCDSYSQFFEYVCDYVGIECKSVNGYIISVDDHEWNRVKVDGVWYYIDTTLNQTYDNQYYLSTSLWTDTHVIRKEYKRSESYRDD